VWNWFRKLLSWPTEDEIWDWIVARMEPGEAGTDTTPEQAIARDDRQEQP